MAAPFLLARHFCKNNIMNNIVQMPKRPDGIQTRIVNEPAAQYISVNGYTAGQQRVLGTTIDEIEIEVNLATYDRMENDSTIIKGKRILLTNVLSDDLQMAPGATEDEVGPEEYDIYVEIMEFCQRCVAGLESPYRLTLEQLTGNSVRHGHGIGEIEWEYRIDGSSSKPEEPGKDDILGQKKPKSKFSAMFERFGLVAKKEGKDGGGISRPSLENEQVRLMPRRIKVKPRGAAQFVVDDYMNIIGLVPGWRNASSRQLNWDEIVSREKFVVLTMNKQDEDPRGRSSYRAAFNWFNLKSQIPAEMLRFILEESVPKAVGTLPEEALAFEFERDQNGNVVYDDPETKKAPRMLTAAESMGRQIKDFRSGSGAVIPYGAKLEPFKKNGASDADFFYKVIKVIDDQMENSILLQTLAQSEGNHQARSASQQVAELLHNLVFWIRWLIATMTLTDLLENAVRINFGEWALRYMPMVSLGDFVRRDWAGDVEVIAKAYFWGFIDDTQRAELMAWLNLPRPGPSRFEQGQNVLAQTDVNGDPVMPNNGRPDKQTGNKDRNKGNSTEKKNGNNTNATYGFGPLNALGHHGGRAVRSARNLYSGRR